MEGRSNSYNSQQMTPLQPPTHSVPAAAGAKWIQDTEEDSDSDQVGLVPHNRGYKHILFFF
jgi:hypothetical protein